MKKDVILVTIGIVIASLFFYINDSNQEPPALNSIEQKIEQNEELSNSGSTKPEKMKLNSKVSSEDIKGRIDKTELDIIETETDNDTSYFAIDDGFKSEPMTVGSSKEFDLAFEEQEIDHDWKFAVENEILLDFTDSLHKKSAWIESYECKYSLCRVEIKQTEGLVGEEKIDDYIRDEIRTLNEVTNTMGMSIPEHSKDQNSYIFFLMRKEVKLNNNS